MVETVATSETDATSDGLNLLVLVCVCFLSNLPDSEYLHTAFNIARYCQISIR